MSELGRTVKEWIGKTPDTPAPPRVRLRRLLEYDRKDYITGEVIRPGDEWDLDHIIALANGGENRESNLAPVLRKNHRVKTAEDRKTQTKTNNMTKAAYGIEPRKQKINSRGFPKRKKPGRIQLDTTLPPPPLMRGNRQEERG